MSDNFKLYKVNPLILDKENRDTFDSMLASVKADQEVLKQAKEVNLISDEDIRKNVAPLYSLKEDLDYCRHCPGFDECSKAEPHYCLKLVTLGKFINTKIVPCPLLIEDMKKDELYVARDFPSSWRQANTDNWDKSAERRKIKRRFVESSTSPKNWIYIVGSHRSGKSYVAASLINTYIIQEHQKVAFINYPIRIRKLNDLSYNDKDLFFKYIDLFSTVEVLVIDDFGNEYKNEYIRDSITLQILNERARRGLMTIFTSSFDFDEIMNMYSINASGRARGKQLKELLEDYASEPIDITCAKIY